MECQDISYCAGSTVCDGGPAVHRYPPAVRAAALREGEKSVKQLPMFGLAPLQMPRKFTNLKLEQIVRVMRLPGKHVQS